MGMCPSFDFREVVVEVGRAAAVGLKALQKHARGNAVGEHNVCDASGLRMSTVHGQGDGHRSLTTDQQHAVAQTLLHVVFVHTHH